MKSLLCFLSFFSIIFTCSGYEEVPLRELLGKSYFYDGKKIEIEAEVLEILRRKKECWLNVYSEGVSLGVWVKGCKLPLIRSLGSYQTEGDLLRIKGVFFSSCPEHRGERDLHAQEISLIREGRIRKEMVPLWKKGLVLFLGFFFFSVLALYFYYIKRDGRKIQKVKRRG